MSLIGTCGEMCSADELPTATAANRSQRTHLLESWSATEIEFVGCTHAKKRGGSSSRSDAVEYTTLVSPYRRSAAASQSSSPSIRTPSALLSTSQHLFSCVLRRRRVCPFTETYRYIADRSRQIKKEVTIQSLSSHSPLQSLHIMKPLLLFHIISAYILSGEEEKEFDSTLNEERVEDYLEEVMEACRNWIRGNINSNNGSAAAVLSSSSAAPTIADSSSPSPSTLQLEYDRFRSYSLLLHIDECMIRLRERLTEDQQTRSYQQTHGASATSSSSSSAAASSSSTASTVALASPPLSPRLSLAVQISIAHTTQDYARFFHLYRLLTDPSRSEYDPVAMAILQRHILPMQLLALKRMSAAFMPNAWYSLHDLTRLLCLPNVPDAALLCKNLARRPVRRSEEWNQATLEQQNTDELTIRANEEARSTGPAIWAVQLTRDVFEEADPIVFRAFYQRELERRVRRMGVRFDSDDSVMKKKVTKDAWDDDEPEKGDASAATPAAASASTSTGSSSVTSPPLPLSCYLPTTRYASDSLIDWIHRA